MSTASLNLTQPEVAFTLQAIRQTARLVRRIQAEMVAPALTKDDRSPVTVADYASQALVAHLLSAAFPGDPLVAEEDSSGLRPAAASGLLETVTRYVAALLPAADPPAVCDWIDRGAAQPARRFWTLDPIDGTKGFLRGDQYAVALALIVDGQVQIGALGCPNLSRGSRPDLGDPAPALMGPAPALVGPAPALVGSAPALVRPGSLVIAARGQGAWVTGLDGEGELEQLHVSHRADPSQARLLRSFESGHTNADRISEFSAQMGIRADPLRMDSQAKYAVLASGKADLLLRLLSPSQPDYREKIWDQAAGALILEEAGGRITDLDGLPLDFTAGRTLAHNRGVLASNALLHGPALAALHAVHA